MFLEKFRKFSAIMLLDFLPALHSFSFFLGLPWHKWQTFCNCPPNPWGTVVLLLNLSFFSLCCSDWLISMVLSSSSLTHLHTALNPSSEFLFQLFYFSILKFPAVLLYIFSVFVQILAQMVKHLPTMRETWVWSLGREDLLEKEMTTHSSILAWKNPMDGEN